MYNAIQITLKPKVTPITESMDIQVPVLTEEVEVPNECDTLYTEAVFSGGKATIKPIEDQIKAIRDDLLARINEQKKADADPKNKKKFDPKAFWRNPAFKELENTVQKVFGFRSVQIQPFVEKYDSKSDKFESKVINALTYTQNRFPIDGLVTDKGFYDNTHSINMEIFLSLGLWKKFEPDVITAALLHEFGHNVDPALMDITYAKVNILSKYLTDRKGALTNAEKKVVQEDTKKGFLTIVIDALRSTGKEMKSFIFDKIFGGKKFDQKLLDKLETTLKSKDKTQFNRQNYSEAFADNFARMYGYGPQLASFFKAMSKDMEEQVNSRFKKEKQRQRAIMYILSSTISDEHKTDVHRIKSLIREYRNDINDPNTPDVVKKQMEDDVKELEKLLDSYMHDFSDFQNKCYKLINDEIEKLDAKSEKPKEEVVKEATEFINDFEFFESKKAYEELRNREKTITSSERAECMKRFGYSKKCSFAKDDKGYYAYTHRCRSKSYPTIADIPHKDVEFVRSTA